MFLDFEWSELMELSHLESRLALAWLESHGIDLEDCDCGDEVFLDDVDLDDDFNLYLGGYWSDGAVCIEFEDGQVVRWYRCGWWD